MTTTDESEARDQFIAANAADEEYPIAPAVDADPAQWPAAHSSEDDEDDRDGHGQYGGSHHGAVPVDLDSHDMHDMHGAQDQHDERDQHGDARDLHDERDQHGDARDLHDERDQHGDARDLHDERDQHGDARDLHDERDQHGDARDLPDARERGDARPRRFDSRVAIGFAGVLIAAIVLAVVASTMVYGGSDEKVVVRQTTIADAAVAVPEPRAPVPEQAAISDRPLPYSADAAGSCPAGSTSAQTMAGADPRNAFVCVRNGIDGQVIDIDLSKTYVVTAISLTPGWIGQDASGVAQWSQHRVVTTVQYAFNDTERTLITQDTKNVHGEAVMPVQRVLASKVRMLIRQTSRPPVDTPASAAAPPDLLPGLPTPPTFAGDPFLGGTSNSDPVDHTFAVSSLKIIGHEPL